eukprot:TRINITY_DN11133_c0_g1_i2.p1 TRINITY_DN11133_c0_g1~~TRINITY_DN11133_c0_g1_i2.p1  ORF type:complete len:561 (+),score=78.23 TRINITY_DN11133_c0_g1_i2:36-1718(+)
MTEAVEKLINENIDLLLYDNAIFYAERLHAASASPGTLHILATVYVKAGKAKVAADLLKHNYPFTENFSNAGNECRAVGKLLYLYGVTLARDNKFLAAERVLRELQRDCYLSGMNEMELSALHYWMGVICTNTKREPTSLDHYGKSVQLFNFNWSSIDRYLSLRPETNFDCVLAAKNDGSETHGENDLNASSLYAHGAHPTSQSQMINTPPTSDLPLPPNAEVIPPQLQRLLLELTKILSACYSFDATAAAQRIYALPPNHRNTGYILGLLAKAQYDDGMYEDAAKSFQKMRSLEPYRLDDKLVYYSSCLWQLRDEKNLAHLAQELIHLDKLSSITQIVLGNTHSVVGEHETAIQFLSRACKIDSLQPYSSTLKGFEHLVLEELEDASQCFRTSLHLDGKHYAAWHGLGTVFMKQERWKEAVVHFERASRINPNPPIMLAYANALMEEVSPGCVEKAFSVVNQVLSKYPNHALARLRQGEILLKRGRLNAAKDVAVSLLGTAPREPKINLLLARIYKKLGDRNKALQHFTFALGLKPRDSAAIKLELDRYQEGGTDDETD